MVNTIIILCTDKFCARWDEVAPRPDIWQQVELARIFRTRYNLVRTKGQLCAFARSNQLLAKPQSRKGRKCTNIAVTCFFMP